MQAYGESTGWEPAFEVRYRFLSKDEGGRSRPPRQHVRWDFAYAEDEPTRDGIYMIWPEFIDPCGAVLPEGEVPLEGRASMFIVNPELREYHRNRITIGTRGHFVEGPHLVAECEVIAIKGLARENAA